MVAVLLTGAAGLLTGAAVAEHQFTDVPDGNVFHEDIADFYEAGCATGYAGNTFRPTNPVLRQQMARFTGACGGRVAFELSGPITLSGTPQQVATLQLDHGALRGAGFVVVHAAVRIVSNSSTGFPCDVLFDIVSTPTPTNFEEIHVDLPADTSDPIEDASALLVSNVTPGPAGGTTTATLRANKTNGCAATVQAFGNMSITYWPFFRDGDGGGPEVGP